MKRIVYLGAASLLRDRNGPAAISIEGGTAEKAMRFRGLGIVNMYSNDGRQESGNWELPRSSWTIPVITGLVILLAFAAALT